MAAPPGALLGGPGIVMSTPVAPSPPLSGQVNRIAENRRCRDVLFLLLFVAFWVGMVIIAGIAFKEGKPDRLIYGLDYKGNLCNDKGATPDLSGLETRFWLNPNQVYDSGDPLSPFTLQDARSICLGGCPQPGPNGTLAWVCDYPEGTSAPLQSVQDWVARKYDYYDLLTAEQQQFSANMQGPCWPVLFRTRNLLWSCQFDGLDNESYAAWQALNGKKVQDGIFLQKAVESALRKPSAVVSRYVADLGRAWPVLVVCGGIIPLVLSFTWLLVIRLVTDILAWLTILIINVLFLALTVFVYIKAGWLGNDAISAIVGDSAAQAILDASDNLPLGSLSTTERNHLKIVAVIMTIITVLVVIVTIIMIRRIRIAIAVLKVAAKAIGAIPLLIFFPLLPFIIASVFFVYWFAVAIFLFSAGNVVQNKCDPGDCCVYNIDAGALLCNAENCCGFSTVWTQKLRLSFLLHIFGLFWTTEFIVACALTTVAGAVAGYYWVRGDARALPLFPVGSSASRVARFHLGSMALGSLLVAIVEMLRFIAAYIRRKLRGAEDAPGGSLISLSCCCVQCCLGCLEWIVRFINRNAYIMIAISGDSFFRSAARAVELLLNNILRVAAVSVIGDFMLFLGKAAVAAASTLLAFFFLDSHRFKFGTKKISSPLLPVLFCWVLSYFVASIFFAVLEMAVDTILLSFCQDCEENGGTARFAPPLLMDALGSAKQMADAEEEALQRRRAAKTRT